MDRLDRLRASLNKHLETKAKLHFGDHTVHINRVNHAVACEQVQYLEEEIGKYCPSLQTCSESSDSDEVVGMY